MENSEKLKMCRTCENRRFNGETGMTCSLTNGKPIYESQTCPDYVCDTSTYLREYDKEQDEKAEVKSHKTTALVFLWIFIVLSILGTLSSFYLLTIKYGFNLIFIPLTIMGAIYMTLCVKTLIAFHKQKNNAIALIISVAAISVISCLSGMVFSLVVGSFTANPLRYILALILWGAIIAYLFFSENLGDVIPKESRTWEKPEKWLVGIYAVLCIAFYTVLAISIL